MNVIKSLAAHLPKRRSVTSRFKRDEAGNIAIMSALGLFAFVAGLAMAVDVSKAYQAHQRLQNTTDAIALLAAKDGLESQQDLTAAANAYYAQTYPGDRGTRIEIESINRMGDTVNVRAKNNIDTYFTAIFGQGSMDLGVSSTATYAQRALDVALVLDTTGSMSGTKIASLKVAANDLLDTFASLNNDKLRVSVVPFAQYVNVGADKRGASYIDDQYIRGRAWQGCVGSQNAPLDERAAVSGAGVPAGVGIQCATPLRPLTANMNQAKQTVTGMQARGWTYMPAGLVWGYRTLSPSQPFAVRPVNGAAMTEKVMIMMTDGKNTRSKIGQNHEGWDTNAANRKTEALCNQIKRDNITVYTIAYDVNDATTVNLLRRCASDNDKAFTATSASDLKDAFAEIGANLNDLRITA